MQFQHFHPFYEICVPLSPEVTHFLEGKPYDLQPFDVIGIAPSVLHMTRYPEGAPCKRLIIRFNLPRHIVGLSNEYEQLLGVFHQEVPIFRFEPELRSRLMRKLNDIFLLAGKTDAMRNLIIHLKFIEFLTLLFLNRDESRYANGAEMTDTQRKIYTVAGFIHAHYAEPLSLESLSQRFFISSYYLSHQFKQVTGFTLTDYIQMTRVRNVQSLLMGSGMQVTEIALACGFSSFSQFNRVFQKHIGMTPSKYRAQNRIHAQESEE